MDIKWPAPDICVICVIDIIQIKNNERNMHDIWTRTNVAGQSIRNDTPLFLHLVVSSCSFRFFSVFISVFFQIFNWVSSWFLYLRFCRMSKILFDHGMIGAWMNNRANQNLERKNQSSHFLFEIKMVFWWAKTAKTWIFKLQIPVHSIQ